MKKTQLEQLTAELLEQLKYLRDENVQLKDEIRNSRKNFLEVIDKWNKTVDELSELRKGKGV